MMKLFSKNSNLCDHNSPTLQTDGQTDRETTCDSNTALCTKVHRAGKKLCYSADKLDILLRGRKDTLTPAVSALRGRVPPLPSRFRRLCDLYASIRYTGLWHARRTRLRPIIQHHAKHKSTDRLLNTNSIDFCSVRALFCNTALVGSATLDTRRNAPFCRSPVSIQLTDQSYRDQKKMTTQRQTDRQTDNDLPSTYTVSQKKHVTTFSTITLTIGVRLQ